MKKNRLVWLNFSLCLGILLISRSAFGLDPTQSLLQYNCRSWTRQNALPANGIRALAQTAEGYLWIGTQKGLLRFDGNDFVTINPPSGLKLPTREIKTIAAGRQGLWFGLALGGGGFYDDVKTFRPFTTESREQEKITAIRETADGSLWIGTESGIFRRNGAKTIFNNEIRNALCIFEDARHRIWVATADNGLNYWEAGKFHKFPDPEMPQMVFSVTVDSTGRIWAGTPFGLRCYDPNFKRNDPFRLFTETRALLCDRHGVLWIGTTGDGLLRYQGGNTPTMLMKTNGLANDFVTALLEDREGSLWVGTREGLTQLSDVKFPIFSSSEGWARGPCHGVCASPRGGVWSATSSGASYFDGKTTSVVPDEAWQSQSHYIKRVLEARDGDLYLLNGNREVQILSSNKIVASYSNSDWPTALVEDAHGVVVSVGAKLFRVSRKGMTPFPFQKTPEFYWIRNLSAGSDGSLIVASVNGIFRINGEKIEHWTTGDGLPNNDVLCACEDPQRTIWVGQTCGLTRIRNGRPTPICQELVNTVVMSMVPDNRGNLWLDSHRGFIRVSRASLNDFADGKSSELDGTVFDGLESVKTIDNTEIEFVGCKANDGSIWFPTPQGAVKIDPDDMPTNSTPPPVRIQKIVANGIELTNSASNQIPPGKGELAFQYTGLSFIAPQKIQFRYKLEGYDTEWIEAGMRRNAAYTNLKPKRYKFIVQACNADGVWGEQTASCEIELPPRFYQTAWFQLICSTAIILGIVGIYRWRVGHLRRKEKNLQAANELLETKIRDRTRELAEQRNLLRTLIDHLPDEVFVKDADGRVIIDNLAHARSLGVQDPADAIGKTDFESLPEKKAEEIRRAELALLQSGKEYNREENITFKNGESRWLRTTKVPLRNNRGEIIGLAGIHRDMTERKKAEAEMESLHKQLLETSRQAGMAEVATSVLHNVGNVLNSVNISASMIDERVRNSALQRIHKVLALLQENRSDLSGFFSQQEKGTKLVDYMDALVKALDEEKEKVREEVRSLTDNIEHIKKIVAMQQSYARVAGVVETVSPSELIEDSLRMQETALRRHDVKIIREYSEVPKISVDRHKAIQILVNLFQNAKHACDMNEPDDRIIRIGLKNLSADLIQITVTDNGSGIAAEHLTRIFSYGFTTKKHGHGFGLHGGALAAKEMGGSLTAHSDGAGKGATFTLELPVNKDDISTGKTATATKAN